MKLKEQRDDDEQTSKRRSHTFKVRQFIKLKQELQVVLRLNFAEKCNLTLQ